MEGREKEINKQWMRSHKLENTNFVIKIGDFGFAKI
jgi:hypothetical protein